MTFVLFLVSLAVIYAFLLSFLNELTKADVPNTVLIQHESQDQQVTAA